MRNRTGKQEMCEAFRSAFGTEPSAFFQAPGRVEICGNHCDHQNGKVIAAAIDTYTFAAVRPRTDSIVRICSEGYGEIQLDISDLSVHEEEKGSSAGLVRGMAKALAHIRPVSGGFSAYMESEIEPGSGLSSSAAFEVLLGRILLSDGSASHHAQEDDMERAFIIADAGRFAENVYFGKPCGLMDQAASAAGSLVYLDLRDPEAHAGEKLPSPFGNGEYDLCLVHTGGSHADLTNAYAEIPMDMRRVAELLGAKVLRDVDEKEFYTRIPMLREQAGDRAVFRAMHFFDEMKRVERCRESMLRGDVNGVISAIRESGESSSVLLQNVETGRDPMRQDMAMAIALSKEILCGQGAVRVHGGGFAGTVLAVVPSVRMGEYTERMEAVFGKGSVCRIRI